MGEKSGGFGRGVNGLKIKIASGAGFAIFLTLFGGQPLDGSPPGKDKGPDNARARVSAGGHNNTEYNPVFRGMVRRKNPEDS